MYRVFCATTVGSERHTRMAKRLPEATWVPAVRLDDPRVLSSPHDPKASAVMYVHLDMIRAFLDSDAEYGILCEDDIYVRRDFQQSIHVAIDAHRRLNLDVLLLGYLLPYKPIEFLRPPMEPPFYVFDYGQEQWGTQMYMLNRTSATKIYESFSDPHKVPVFASDWTITKYGRRGMLYPMLAIEEGYVNTDHAGQIEFHRKCCDVHYNPAIYA